MGNKPNERFIKAVQKAATGKGMTVAEYRDKILFPHGKNALLQGLSNTSNNTQNLKESLNRR